MTHLKIGGVPEHFNLPWHLALEQYLFANQGVNLEWVEFPDGTGAMNKALRTGSIDLAVILTGGIIKDIVQGNPSRIIQMYVSSPLIWGVHVDAESSFQTLDDLEGARPAISRFGSGSHVMAHIQAHQQGWETDRLSFVEVGTLPQAVTALKQDEADYFMWEHFTTKPLVDKGVFRRVADFPTPWSCFVIAATQNALDSKSQAIKTVMSVINTMTATFKKIPAIDLLLSRRYEQELIDIKKWLATVEWSQIQISDDEISRVQKRLYELDMISEELPIHQIKTALN